VGGGKLNGFRISKKRLLERRRLILGGDYYG
jgi:hypothetical protein